MSETVIVGLGSNMGDCIGHLKRAKSFLTSLADSQFTASSIYRSEPLGPAAKHEFLNAVASFKTGKTPEELLHAFKTYEYSAGRDREAPRWSDRPIDLDIIALGNRIIKTGSIQIPHPEYPNRIFVLLPLAELYPEWTDPETGVTIDRMIAKAPALGITKTNLEW